MEINILDYLSQDEIKDACRSAVYDQAKAMLKSEKDLDRIMGNEAYYAVWKCVDDVFNVDFNHAIAMKIPDIIQGLTDFCVFRPKDSWNGRDESTGYKILSEVIKENRHMIDDRVKDLICQIDMEEIKDAFVESLDRVIENLKSK